MKCKICGKHITAERRKSYCSNECYLKSKIEERKKPKNERINPGAALKNKDVCKGCRYLLSGQGTDLKNTCNYAEVTGHSRIMVERANGGVKADSCICYEAGSRERKSKGAY